jgi:hypothetical protein
MGMLVNMGIQVRIFMKMCVWFVAVSMPAVHPEKRPGSDPYQQKSDDELTVFGQGFYRQDLFEQYEQQANQQHP